MEKSTRSFYLKLLLIVVLMVGIGMLPPIGSITEYGMKVLGIFIGCIVGWGVGYQYVTSMLALVLLAFCGENNFNSVFSGAFGSPSILMVFFSFIFCYGIEQTGFMQYVARWILSRKFAAKGLWTISLAFWIACAVCSALITNTLPVIILLWTMFYSIVEQTGVEKNSPWVHITMIMMCVVGYTGSVVMPYAGWNLMCYGIAQSVVPELQVNLLAHTTLMFVLNILIIAMLFLVSRFVLGRSVTECKIDKDILAQKGEKMNGRQKAGLIYLIILGLMLFLPNVLQPTVPGIGILKALTNTGAFVIVTLLLCVTQIDGKPLMNVNETMKHIPWGLMFLLYAALYLAGLIASPDTGIGATIVTFMNSFIGGLGVFGIMFVFVAFGCIVTNAINNVVCVNLFVPIGCAMLAGLGGNPSVLTALLCPILYLGLVLPSGSAVGALMHGNAEWLPTAAIYKYASIGCLIVIICCTVVGIPLGNILFN